MKPDPDKPAEISLSVELLDAVTPEGRGAQLVITAKDEETGEVTTSTVEVPGLEP